MKRILIFAIIVIVLAALFVLARHLQLPYTISSRGMVLPMSEWTLKKTGDGTLASVYKDNLRNITSQFSITEFQRGDLAGFVINEAILNQKTISKGDTVGQVTSMAEEKRRIELLAELQVQHSLMQVHKSGEKPELVQMAREDLVKAENEYETQKKLTERQAALFEKAYISAQDYELSQNAYLVKKHEMNRARAHFEAISSGSKDEQLNYIRANIESLEMQLEQVTKRIDAFTVVSPISGKLIERRNINGDQETILQAENNNTRLVILPIELHQLPYIKPGQTIRFKLDTYGQEMEARVHAIDNAVQMVDQRQKLFLTAVTAEIYPDLLSGTVVEASIDCGMISAAEFFRRLFRIVYAN